MSGVTNKMLTCETYQSQYNLHSLVAVYYNIGYNNGAIKLYEMNNKNITLIISV